MDYRSEIIVAINQLHGCAARYAATVPVTEIFQGKILWEGDVEIFDLAGHPKAKKAYAWGHPVAEIEGVQREITTVLEIPPVESPETAVKAAIVAAAKK